MCFWIKTRNKERKDAAKEQDKQKRFEEEQKRLEECEARMTAYFKRRQEEVTQEVLEYRKSNGIKIERQSSWII
jgi:hypothetical protein